MKTKELKELLKKLNFKLIQSEVDMDGFGFYDWYILKIGIWKLDCTIEYDIGKSYVSHYFEFDGRKTKKNLTLEDIKFLKNILK